MYITVDDIKNEISLYHPIDNSNRDKNKGEIHYHVENKTDGGKTDSIQCRKQPI